MNRTTLFCIALLAIGCNTTNIAPMAMPAVHQETPKKAILRTVGADPVVGTKIILRACKYSDEYRDALFATLTPKVRLALGDAKTTRFEMGGTILKEHGTHTCGKSFSYCIFDIISNKMIGFIGTKDLDPSSDTVDIGGWVAEQYWGKGHYQEALKLLVGHLFDSLSHLEACTVHIKSWNGRSLGAHTKFGFSTATCTKQDCVWCSKDIDRQYVCLRCDRACYKQNQQHKAIAHD